MREKFGKVGYHRQTNFAYNYNLLAESIHPPNFSPPNFSPYVVHIFHDQDNMYHSILST